MIEINTKLRKWGNSLGIVIPFSVFEKRKLKEGDEITIFIKNEDDTLLKEMFGSFKFKKSTDKLMKEVNEELYDI